MQKWTIGKRIGGGFAVVIAILLFIAGFAYRNSSSLAFLAAVSKSSVENNLFMVERQVDHLTWIHGLDLYLLDNSEFNGQLDERKCRLGEWLNGRATLEAAGDAGILSLLKAVEAPHTRLHRSARQIVDAKKAGNNEEARRVFAASTIPALAGTTDSLAKLRKRHDAIRNEKGGQAAEDLARSASQNSNVLLMVSGVGALGALILAWVIGRGISSSLGRTASELAETANQVAAAAEQVASSSQSLAQGASEQAGSLEETSSSSDQIHAMAERNMDNSRAAAALVQSSAEKVEEASGALDQMVVAIGEIGTSSANIGRIIKVIEDIAFQTNILALNAAVEAARAGESGLGFAVVADEVRNLSQRCAQAAKDTAELIEDSIAKSKEGQVKVDRVAGSVHTVARDFCKVQALVAEVDEGSQEQARGIDQIAKAISQVEEVTRCAAANAEENAAASEELTAQSRTLHDVSETLLAMIRGARAAR